MEGTVADLGFAVMGSVVPTVVYVGILWWFDRYEKEPVWLFTVAFLWGALPAAILSVALEVVLGIPLSGLGSGAGHLLEASALAPLVEEGVKGLALLAIFWLYRAEFDGVLDGIIYGGAIGFGFAMTENVLYFVSEMGKGAVSLGILWGLRSVVFGLNHALFSAALGVGFGLARLARRRWQRWLAVALAFAAAVVLHATHNLFASLADITCWSMLVSVISDWGGLTVILAVIVLSWRQERRWLATQLAEEVRTGVISGQEYAMLSSRAGRLGSFWRALVREGWAAARAQQRRNAWAVELAFKKQQLAQAGPTAGEAAAIDRLRAALRGT